MTAPTGAEPETRPRAKRVIFFDGDVTQASVEQLRLELLAHHGEDPQAEVTIMINSAGGSMLHAMGLHNFAKEVLGSLRIITICTSLVGSAAVPIFMIGQQRLMAPYSSVVLHEARVTIEGREYTTRELDWMVQQLRNIERHYAALISAAGRDTSRPSGLLELMHNNTILTATAACEQGLATGILGQQPKAERPPPAHPPPPAASEA